MLTLVLLTALLAWACLSVARLAEDEAHRSRPLQLVGASVLAQVVIVVAVYGLGDVGMLSATSLAGVVGGAAVTLLIIVGALEGGPTAFWRQQRRQIRRLTQLGPDVWRACRLSGMPIWPVVTAAALLFVWIAFAVCFSPARGNNDALFYHEPIVALTLQEGTLGPFDLPRHLQRINGMPRFCHFVQLYTAAFCGRDLVELPNVLSLPLGTLSTYVLARRVGTQKSTAITWAICWMLTPGIMRLSCGVMVDTHGASWVMAASALLFVPRLSLVRALLAAGAIGLTVGTKYHVVVVTFVLALALLIRIVATRRELGTGRFVLTVITAGSIVVAALAALYVRNWMLFDNPIWPAGVRLPSLGINIRAAHDLRDVSVSGKGLPSADILERWFTSPFSRSAWQGGSARPEDYGLGGRYLAWPLANLAAIWAVVVVVRTKLAKRKVPAHAWIALTAAAVVAMGWAGFPSIVRGRYWLAIIGLFYVLICWLFRAPRLRARARELVFLFAVLTLVSTVWSLSQGWVPGWTAVTTRVSTPRDERDFTMRQLSTIEPALGRLRASEMTAGKTVGMDTGMYSIGILWNDDYSNRVVWMKTGNPMLEARHENVDWLYLYRRRIKGDEARYWDDLGAVLKRRKRQPGRMYRRRAEPRPAPRGEPKPSLSAP